MPRFFRDSLVLTEKRDIDIYKDTDKELVMAQFTDPEAIAELKEMLVTSILEHKSLLQVLLDKGIVTKDEVIGELKKLQEQYQR